MSTGPSDAARTLADWRLEALVELYGNRRYDVSYQISQGVDYQPAFQESVDAYREIADRLTKLRALCLEQLARPGHPRTKRVSAAEVLRILDGGAS